MIKYNTTGTALSFARGGNGNVDVRFVAPEEVGTATKNFYGPTKNSERSL